MTMLPDSVWLQLIYFATAISFSNGWGHLNYIRVLAKDFTQFLTRIYTHTHTPSHFDREKRGRFQISV